MNTTSAHGNISFPDRRKRKEDGWLRLLRWLSPFLYCLFVIFAVILFAGAGLTTEAGEELRGLERMEHILATDGNAVMAFIALVLAGAIISCIGIGINAKRSRRKYDDDQLPILVLGLISSFTVAIYFLYF